jgi:hypothetical protein
VKGRHGEQFLSNHLFSGTKTRFFVRISIARVLFKKCFSAVGAMTVLVVYGFPAAMKGMHEKVT